MKGHSKSLTRLSVDQKARCTNVASGTTVKRIKLFFVFLFFLFYSGSSYGGNKLKIQHHIAALQRSKEAKVKNRKEKWCVYIVLFSYECSKALYNDQFTPNELEAMLLCALFECVLELQTLLCTLFVCSLVCLFCFTTFAEYCTQRKHKQ